MIVRPVACRDASACRHGLVLNPGDELFPLPCVFPNSQSFPFVGAGSPVIEAVGNMSWSQHVTPQHRALLFCFGLCSGLVYHISCRAYLLSNAVVCIWNTRMHVPRETVVVVRQFVLSLGFILPRILQDQHQTSPQRGISRSVHRENVFFFSLVVHLGHLT